MTFAKEQLPDERLVKILAETQAVVTEHNSRCVRGSVEVDARLFESMLVEIQLRRHLMEAEHERNPVLAYADSYRDMAKQGVESIPVWSVITDLERNIAPQFTASPAPINAVTTDKPLTIALPDTSSKAFWSGDGRNEVFHPEAYKRWVKEAIERACAISHTEVRIK